MWPVADPALENDDAEAVGQIMVAIATAVRRFKSERSLSLGEELDRVQLAPADGSDSLPPTLRQALADLKSITRAREIHFDDAPTGEIEFTRLEGLRIYIKAK
jgi:valyl-tRNA synthetase